MAYMVYLYGGTKFDGNFTKNSTISHKGLVRSAHIEYAALLLLLNLAFANLKNFLSLNIRIPIIVKKSTKKNRSSFKHEF